MGITEVSEGTANHGATEPRRSKLNAGIAGIAGKDKQPRVAALCAARDRAGLKSQAI